MPRLNTGQDGRITGIVDGTFPDRGFFWIKGEDGKRYFAHQTKVHAGFLVLDMWEGQKCTFTPKYDDGRGPRAEQVIMEDDA